MKSVFEFAKETQQPRRKKEMDNLAADAVAAERAGMSYGRYKAAHPHTKELRESTHETQQEEQYKYERICKVCGKNFQTNNGRQVYCSMECQRKNHNARHREQARERASARMESGGRDYGEN